MKDSIEKLQIVFRRTEKGSSIKKLLENYQRTALTIERSYRAYNRNPFSRDWVKFNEAIATSLSLVYQMGTLFFTKLKESKDNIESFEFDYEEMRYYSFYLDFIVSKPSSSIFTETPKDTKVNLFPLTIDGITYQIKLLFDIVEDYKLHNKIKSYRPDRFWKKILYYVGFGWLWHIYMKIRYLFIKLSLEDKKREDFERTLDTYYQVFFQRTFLYYDFIFSGDEGVFTKHKFSKELFDRTQKRILDLIESDNTNDKIREVFLKMVIICIDEAYRFNLNLNDKNAKNIDAYDYREIFKNYVTHQKKYADEPEKLIFFEPFVYVLANKVWKLDRIYQNRNEGIDYFKSYRENTIEYIKSALSAIDHYYSMPNASTYELFKKIAELDKNHIVNNIYTKYLSNIKNIGDTNYCLQSENKGSDKQSQGDESSQTENQPSEHNNVKEQINKTLTRAFALKEHEKYKFYRILEGSDINDITVLLNVFGTMVKNKILEQNQCNIHFIGILRSGSFLAHAANVYCGFKNPTISVITHPYLTILPRKKFKRDKSKIQAIYIDEAIKSGYSVQVADLYRKKILMFEENAKNDCQSYLCTLMNFKDYQNKNIAFKYHALASVTFDRELVIYPEYTQYASFDWKGYVNGLSFNEEKIKKQAECGNNCYDLTKIIACSDMLFYVAKVFAETIHEKKCLPDIAMYTGSMEGKLLIDTTVFVYKLLYNDGLNFKIEAKKEVSENELVKYNKYFFDISFVTGGTCAKVSKLDAYGCPFDHIFVIAIEKKNKESDKITSVFDFEEKEE